MIVILREFLSKKLHFNTDLKIYFSYNKSISIIILNNKKIIKNWWNSTKLYYFNNKLKWTKIYYILFQN